MDQAQREMSIDEAYAALEREEYSVAQERYETLRQAFAKDPEVIALGVDVLGAQQLDAEAFELLEEGIKITNQDPSLVAGRAGLLLDMYDDTEGTIADLRGLLSRGCDDEMRLEALLMMGEALLRSQQPQEALETANKALALEAHEPQGFNLKAQACFDLHQFAEGKAAAEQAIALDADFAPGYFSLGEILEAMGDVNAAEKAFAHAREHDPDVYNTPPEMDREAIKALATELPGDLSEAIGNYFSDIEIHVLDRPDVGSLAKHEPKLSPALVMQFCGTARDKNADGDPWKHKAKALKIFRRNLLRASVDSDDVVETLAGAMVEALKNFIGIDEDQLWDAVEE